MPEDAAPGLAGLGRRWFGSEPTVERTPGASFVPDPDELRAATQRELVTLHARILLRMPLFELLVVAAVGAISFGQVPWPLFVAWGMAAVGMELVRATASRWVLARLPGRDVRRLHRGFIVLAAFAGIANSLAAPLFLARLPLMSQALVEVIFYVMPAAAVSVAGSSRPLLAAYTLAVLVPASLSWCAVYPQQAWVVLALTALYWTFLMYVSGDGERLLQRSILIRRERDQMLVDLERSNAESRAATLRAEQAAQARSRVLAAASHDLRQPLHALSIYSAIVSAQPSPDALAEVGRNIDQIVRSLGALLDGLLDLSRLSSGAYVVERRPFALDVVVRDICGEYRSAAQAKGLALVEDLPPMFAAGDPTALTRIVRNLLDNAIKYTARGEIEVSARAVDDRIELAVQDSGKGIAPAEQEKIFEEFYQVDNPGRDRSQGVGLGLSIVRRLCELTGARITVSSTLGHGSRFTVELARAPLAAAAPPRVAGASRAGPSLQGLRVVVVDDEADILAGIRTLLGLWGIEVQTAASPNEVERILQRSGLPDLLIADLRLGVEETGAAMARRLWRSYGEFPVLIVTGETAPEDVEAARSLGFAVLQKPVSAPLLRAAIERLLWVEP